jgi:hypothetical protein
MRGEIIKGIRKQAPAGLAFKRLSRVTLALRKLGGFRGTKALMRSGSLVNSISVARTREGRYEIGVLRSARGTGKNATALYNIAKVHEEGKVIVIRMTPRMRRFLMMAFRKAGMDDFYSRHAAKQVIVIRIPARPFIRPVLDRYASNPQEVELRLAKRMSAMLGLARK